MSHQKIKEYECVVTVCSALVEQIRHPNIIYLLKDVCECELRKPRIMLP